MPGIPLPFQAEPAFSVLEITGIGIGERPRVRYRVARDVELIEVFFTTPNGRRSAMEIRDGLLLPPQDLWLLGGDYFVEVFFRERNHERQDSFFVEAVLANEGGLTVAGIFDESVILAVVSDA